MPALTNNKLLVTPSNDHPSQPSRRTGARRPAAIFRFPSALDKLIGKCRCSPKTRALLASLLDNDLYAPAGFVHLSLAHGDDGDDYGMEIIYTRDRSLPYMDMTNMRLVLVLVPQPQVPVPGTVTDVSYWSLTNMTVRTVERPTFRLPEQMDELNDAIGAILSIN